MAEDVGGYIAVFIVAVILLILYVKKVENDRLNHLQYYDRMRMCPQQRHMVHNSANSDRYGGGFRDNRFNMNTTGQIVNRSSQYMGNKQSVYQRGHHQGSFQEKLENLENDDRRVKNNNTNNFNGDRQSFYSKVYHLRAASEDMRSNGYPHFDYSKKNVKFYNKDSGKVWVENSINERLCCRCHRKFWLKNGDVKQKEGQCIYHGRGFKETVVAEKKVKTHVCCGAKCNPRTSSGCQSSSVHVTVQIPMSELGRFLTTPAPSGKNKKKVYAMDCEMVFTVDGPAVARVSLVDEHSVLVLDAVVRPPKMVVDYNTKYSGLTARDVERATDDLRSCHNRLFEFVDYTTILVGHSLECDLKALRLVHHNVIDTALLFPGVDVNKKYSLSALAAKHLGRTIRNGEGGLHDSAEDARTCLDLLRVKLTEAVPAGSLSD